jgi:valyl-tRNA synthetase
MSKSKGNTIDPARRDRRHRLRGAAGEIDARASCSASHSETAAKRIKREFPKGIDAYGADALRFTFASLSRLGRTLNFDLKRCEATAASATCSGNADALRADEHGRAGQRPGLTPAPWSLSAADRWIVSRLQRAERQVNEALAEYRFDVGRPRLLRVSSGTSTLRLVRGDREGARSPRATPRSSAPTRRTVIRVLRTRPAARPPFVPFIHRGVVADGGAARRTAGDSIMVAPCYPHPRTPRSTRPPRPRSRA